MIDNALGHAENMLTALPLSLRYPRGSSSTLEIVAIDRKIDLHRGKRAGLGDLFKALLHKLITGEIRVRELDLSAFADTQGN